MMRMMWIAALVALAVSIPAHASVRGNLRNSPSAVDLQLTDERFQNAIDVIVESAARNVPTPSSGGNYTYRYNPATDKYEQTSGTFGPTPFMERAETLGRNTWNVGLTFQYLELDEFDGNTVGRDPAPISVNGETLLFYTTPKVIYHTFTLNVTYGITDDLDVNIAIPLHATDFDANSNLQRPGGEFFKIAVHSHVSVGLGDIHLRAKYHVLEWQGLHTALGVDVRLPTGNPADALGTGTGTIQPYFAISHRYFDWIEPQLNAGFEFDVVESAHSRAHYSLGSTFTACKWFDVAFSLLGQSEVDGWRSTASVSGPHVVNGATVQLPYQGISVDRKDYFDAVIAARIRVWDTVTFTGGVQKNLNDEGLRASQWSPILAFQGTF